jgi:rare lipoprotein A
VAGGGRRGGRAFLAATVLVVSAAGCAHRGPVDVTAELDSGWRERGLASWYGHPYHGRQTASGETYDMHQLTAAHRTLPFGTVVRVSRRDTGATVEVRINDRGPFIRGRVIDLSYAAARAIGLDVDGVAPVELRVVEGARRPRTAPPPSRPVEPPPAPGCLWVQVGAFGDAANAARVADVLRGLGETVVVVEGPAGLERVRVGPFVKRSDAEHALNRVRRHYPEARLLECGG